MINVSVDWERSQMLITVVTFAGTPRQNWEISGGFGMHLFFKLIITSRSYSGESLTGSWNEFWNVRLVWRERLTEETRDAGSHYRCGRVGRGLEPPSPHPMLTHTNTVNHNCCIVNARFHTFWHYHHGPTDKQTDGPMDLRINGRTKPPHLKTTIRH